MLEKDEGVFPFLSAHSLHPFNQIVFIVSGAPQTQVTPLGGADNFREWFLVRVRYYQRAVLRAQQGKDFCIEPAFMTKLERRPRLRRQPIKESSEPLRIFLHVRRKLKEHDDETLCQQCGALQQILRFSA